MVAVMNNIHNGNRSGCGDDSNDNDNCSGCGDGSNDDMW